MFGGYLKQSTAVTVAIGPYVDATDGFTEETGLTLSQADHRLSKNGGAFAQKNESSASAHMEHGWYAMALDATDTGTLGRLQAYILDAGARAVEREFTVVPANTYDSLVLGTDFLDAAAAELATQAKEDVNAEVVDVMATDTHAQIGQGAPAATASYATMWNYLYKALRNKKTQTATVWSLFNDDAATVDQKSAVSNDGTTASFGEIASGP